MAARPTVVPDHETADELDEELLPGGPEPALADEADLRPPGPVNTEALRGDADRSVLPDDETLGETEVVTAPDGDAWVAGEVEVGEAGEETVSVPARPQRKRIRRKPPENLGPIEAERPVHLRVISIGRTIKNVSVSLVFDLDYPIDGIAALMGEHAHSAVFRSDYLGNGLLIKAAPIASDVENKVTQQIKVQLPRFDQGADQIDQYILPLLPEEVDLSSLIAMSMPWRLNVQVDFPGMLTLHRMQESFDLTGKDAADGSNEPV